LEELIAALKPNLGSARRVGFPAVLGLERSIQVHQRLEEALGRPVFEIPGLPPSNPGIRLHNLLAAAARKYGAQVFNGMKAEGHESTASSLTRVFSEAAARQKPHQARAFVLATGGILGGGLSGEPTGIVRECVFDLPVAAPASRSDWFSAQFLDPAGHPVYQSGVPANADFQPVRSSGEVVFDNLFAAGGIMGGGDYVLERSLDGIALVTGWMVAGKLAERLAE
jgi:glycerol-3-phosphate dehydrogenase subunit B